MALGKTLVGVVQVDPHKLLEEVSEISYNATQKL